jgi:hypothetical protein
MIRLLMIALLIAIAYILLRYRSNARVQKWAVLGLLSGFIIYIVAVVIAELMH